MTALIGSPDLRTNGPGGADEYLLWGSFTGRQLLAEIRRWRLDLFVVVYNKDYCAKLTYWKAVALAILSGAKGKLFCEQGRLPGPSATLDRIARPSAGAAAVVSAIAIRGIPRVIIHLLAEAYVVALGSFLLLVLAGVVAADLGEALARPFGRGGRSQAI
jgi:hypothetical protein